MFCWKRIDKKKRILAGAINIVFAMIALMIVSAFADESVVQDESAVQDESYNLTLNKKPTGVFGRGVSYEGISLEGKTRLKIRRQQLLYSRRTMTHQSVTRLA